MPTQTLSIDNIPKGNQNFGAEVAITENFIIVSDTWDNENGTNAGAIYTYSWSGTQWIPQQKITPLSPSSNVYFGTNIVAHGDRFITKSPFEDKIYIFEWIGTTWTEFIVPLDPSIIALRTISINDSYAAYSSSKNAYVFSQQNIPFC